jgi:hypothetical protein
MANRSIPRKPVGNITNEIELETMENDVVHGTKDTTNSSLLEHEKQSSPTTLFLHKSPELARRFTDWWGIELVDLLGLFGFKPNMDF